MFDITASRYLSLLILCVLPGIVDNVIAIIFIIIGAFLALLHPKTIYNEWIVLFTMPRRLAS